MNDHGACPKRHQPPWIGRRVPVRVFRRAAAEQRGHRPAVQIQPVRLGEVGDRGQRQHPSYAGRACAAA
ncbi:hypothetical protein JNW89_15050 [Micromonospora sp. 4G55]|nr:hypothetical protein [Micromonospora sp. 4G55]